MNVFGKYADYYDLLYRDKDYPGEAGFVHRLIQAYAPGARNILDLGCGTGAHDRLLAERGYDIHGIDFSQDMLDRAVELRLPLPPETASRLSFSQGDLRSTRLGRKFDAIIALFHVISYQPGNEDLISAFHTVRHHLDPGGVFVFDCWYGPAVLADPPAARTKKFENEEITVTRIADPVIYPNENCVDVNYRILVKNRHSGSIEEFEETHRMRYLFRPEVERFMAELEMRIMEFGEWMTRREPDLDSWGV
jgi:SAM-dependent methyltransferase